VRRGWRAMMVVELWMVAHAVGCRHRVSDGELASAMAATSRIELEFGVSGVGSSPAAGGGAARPRWCRFGHEQR
jgi:hypothetical protein